jgi:YHS domain-containing protein
MRYLIQLFLIVFVGFLLVVVFKILKRENQKEYGSKENEHVEEIRKDPICGTYIPISQAVKFNDDNGVKYFCSEECLYRFKKEIKKNE